MRYSVIIPVYKAEKTLERCLDSLLNQPHEENIEILLINDGSPDKCGVICEKYACENPCVRYFYKDNGGVSSARNLGLEEAKGEYILFVDSDDYVSPDYFAHINRAIEDNQPDMLLFGYQNFGGRDGAWNSGAFFVEDELAIAKRASESIRNYLFSSLWSKLFKRDIIEANHLRFDEELFIGEDQTFIFRYAMSIKNLMSAVNILYHVDVESQDSLSRKSRDYLTEQLLKSLTEMMATLRNAALSDEAKRVYRDALAWMFYRGAYSSAKELLKFDLSGKERRKKIREICKQYSKEHVRSGDWKCWVIALPVKMRMASLVDILVKRASR